MTTPFHQWVVTSFHEIWYCLLEKDKDIKETDIPTASMEFSNAPERPWIAASEFLDVSATSSSTNSTLPRLPRPSRQCLSSSINPERDLHGRSTSDTVLYLAYGSNLSVEKFRGARGIRPISQINVQVPSLRLTFDLPGIAYQEPCFANSALRDPDNDRPNTSSSKSGDEKSTVQKTTPVSALDYHKNRWHKGLVGVVYEVTREDYAHIIATEGGGTSYKDIVVDCYPFASNDITTPVPQDPETTPFKAHTLFAPAVAPPERFCAQNMAGRFARPDPSYAQPSARYLKLITDGAAELQLPMEYQNYLRDIRPYQKTTVQQSIGGAVFLAIWGPWVLLIMKLGVALVNKDGKLPKWLQTFLGVIFRTAWISYDNVFFKIFGDGERTLSDHTSPHDANDEANGSDKS